jgi:hypothetical protein
MGQLLHRLLAVAFGMLGDDDHQVEAVLAEGGGVNGSGVGGREYQGQAHSLLIVAARERSALQCSLTFAFCLRIVRASCCH